jgi:hypothetical protein
MEVGGMKGLYAGKWARDSGGWEQGDMWMWAGGGVDFLDEYRMMLSAGLLSPNGPKASVDLPDRGWG